MNWARANEPSPCRFAASLSRRERATPFSLGEKVARTAGHKGFQPRYCSSLTFSSQSTALPSSFSWMAIWVMAVVGAAPCQCFSPGANETTSPGRISSIGPPSRCDPAAARGDDQGLAERMGVPGRARAGLEGDASAGHARRVGRAEQRIDPHRAGEPVGRPLAGRLRTASLDLHCMPPFSWPQSSAPASMRLEGILRMLL